MVDVIKIDDGSGKVHLLSARAIVIGVDETAALNQFPNHLHIDKATCLFHLLNAKQLHPGFEVVGQDFVGDQAIARLQRDFSYIQHLAGLFDITLKLIDAEIPFVWIKPNLYWAPGLESRLNELTLLLIKYTTWTPEQLLTCNIEMLRKLQAVRPIVSVE